MKNPLIPFQRNLGPVPVSIQEDGTLLRTLWSNVEKDAGTYKTPEWDGKDDDGKDVISEATEIKVLSNNVKYVWEGVIGNNSTPLTGPGVQTGIQRFYGMVVRGNYAYVGTGYNEG